MEERPDIVEHGVDVLSTHLGRAVELYFHAVATSATHEPRWNWILSRRHSLSSIVHAYCGLEAAVSGVSQQLFFDDESDILVALDQRDVPLRRMLQNWTISVPLVDKLSVILSHLHSNQLSDRLVNELRELNTLRNWILHGFSFKTTILLSPMGDDHFEIVDQEDSVDWQKKFPNTKFSRLDDLGPQDAQLALRIVLSTLQHLAKARGSRYMIIAYFDKPYTFDIEPDSDVIDRILNMAFGEDPTRQMHGTAYRRP